MGILQSLTQLYRTEGDLAGALQGDDCVSEDHEWAVKALHEMIKQNRTALGILHENDHKEASIETIKLQEIRPEALKLHIAMVRHDLMRAHSGKPEFTASRKQIISVILQELTNRTETSALGELASRAEHNLVQAARRKNEPKETKPKSKWQPDENGRLSREAEFEALMIQLRRAGKIL